MKVGEHNSSVGSYAIMGLLFLGLVVAFGMRYEPVNPVQTHIASR